MILHIDMDAFYASVEIRDNPDLAGLPVVVGGSPKGRGVISAASYEARKFGIHSAMPASKAIQLCPKAVFIKPRMEHYARISKQIRGIFNDFTSLVEPLSLDEAFLDVTGCTALFGDAPTIAQKIKKRIKDELGLIASAGVAPNKFLAKLSSDLDKPDGLVVVPADDIEGFLAPLDVSRVWGVGKQTEKKLKSLGVTTIGQLRELTRQTLKSSFGINSEHFWRLSRGLDTRPVVPDRDAKSISHETTFAIDIIDAEALSAWLHVLTDQVTRRMRCHSIVGRTVQIKLRYSNFETITRAETIQEPTNSTVPLHDVAHRLLCDNLSGIKRGIRLLGMGVSNLSHDRHVQQMLFDRAATEKSRQIDKTTDLIRDRFGSFAVNRATSLEHGIKHRPDPRVNEE